MSGLEKICEELRYAYSANLIPATPYMAVADIEFNYVCWMIGWEMKRHQVQAERVRLFPMIYNKITENNQCQNMTMKWAEPEGFKAFSLPKQETQRQLI